MSRRVRFVFALLVLIGFLGTGAAHARPPEGPGPDGVSGMLEAVWDWVASVVGIDLPFLPVQEADTVSVPLPPPPGTDGGGFIDPNGDPH
jgi:hypothetical protein